VRDAGLGQGVAPERHGGRSLLATLGQCCVSVGHKDLRCEYGTVAAPHSPGGPPRSRSFDRVPSPTSVGSTPSCVVGTAALASHHADAVVWCDLRARDVKAAGATMKNFTSTLTDVSHSKYSDHCPALRGRTRTRPSPSSDGEARMPADSLSFHAEVAVDRLASHIGLQAGGIPTRPARVVWPGGRAQRKAPSTLSPQAGATAMAHPR
jgi:hypothetical protein